jgi:hypothetical protein
MQRSHTCHPILKTNTLTMVVSEAFASWDEISPDPQAHSFYAPSPRLHIDVGSFLLLQGQIVVRFIKYESIMNVQYLVGNVFVPASDSQAVPLLPSATVIGVLSLAQSLKKKKFLPEEVEDLCFVFTPQAILDGSAQSVAGMTNVFVCGYRFTGLQSDAICNLTPFPSQALDIPSLYKTCTSYNLWCSILCVQDTLRRTLSSARQSTGDYWSHSEKIPLFPLDSWNYIVKRLEEIAPIVTKKRFIRHCLHRGYSSTSHSVSATATLIRIETESQISLFAGLFGDTSLYGSRLGRPKVSDKYFLQLGHALNYVSGSDVSEAPFKKRTTELGIDLIHDGTILVVQVRYGKWLHSPDPVPFPSAAFGRCFQHLPCNNVGGDQTSVDGSSVVSVQIGDSFDHQGQCLIIKGFRDDGAVICGNESANESDSENDANYKIVLRNIEYVRNAVKINLI